MLAQPHDTNLADKTLAALSAVHNSTDGIARAVAQYEPSKSTDFKQSDEQLASLQQGLESYVASLRAPLEPPAAATTPATEQPGQPAAPSSTAVQTETIEAPAAVPPPATTAEAPDTMRVYQAKVLLHKLYVATYRLNDLLGLVHPEGWKVPLPLRISFTQRVGDLRKQIAALDNARVEFAANPDDAYLGFRTYVEVGPVLEGISRVSNDIAQYEGSAVGSDFVQPAQWLTEARHDLLPYIGSVLQTREQAIHGYQADLATCQNTLNYALHPRVAAPMPNFMPILKGVRPRKPAKTSVNTLGGKENTVGTKSKKKAARGRASGR